MRQFEILAANNILDNNFLRDLIIQIILAIIALGFVMWIINVAISKFFPKLKSWQVALLMIVISACLVIVAGLVTQQLGL